ncbi:transposase [Paeniglutamicibacter cryotolerans]|uniref:Transposase n=1 Tax=Paeniglutamicibacter cryotolerans TaxID=670079 RepID=A0A839QGT3_9MICC|nr:transposase [Paeniglutamicibacter cryotolerans]
MAMDMSAEFREAVCEALPAAEISVDHFYLLMRANQMVAVVRLRCSHETVGRRGRMTEPSYKYRKLLTCNVENMSSRQQVRLEEIIAADIELGVVYAVKEKVRELLKTTDLQAFGTAWEALEAGVRVTTMPEAKSLLQSLTSWKVELQVFCVRRLTNARSEAANLTVKNMKRIGRGYRNHRNYRLRMLLSTAGLRPC